MSNDWADEATNRLCREIAQFMTTHAMHDAGCYERVPLANRSCDCMVWRALHNLGNGIAAALREERARAEAELYEATQIAESAREAVRVVADLQLKDRDALLADVRLLLYELSIGDDSEWDHHDFAKSVDGLLAAIDVLIGTTEGKK
jgi:hypothetical protein